MPTRPAGEALAPRRGGPYTAAETETRRRLVYQLRNLQRLPLASIQRALADQPEPILVSEETISNDIAVWVQRVRERYDIDAFDPREVIAEMVEGFDFIASRAARIFITPGNSTTDIVNAGKLWLFAIDRKVALLTETGFLCAPDRGGRGGVVITEDEARSLLEAATVVEAELVPPGERAQEESLL